LLSSSSVLAQTQACSPDIFNVPIGNNIPASIAAINKTEPVLGVFNPSLINMTAGDKLLVGIIAPGTTIAGMSSPGPRFVVIAIGAPNGVNGPIVTKVFSIGLLNKNDVNARYINPSPYNDLKNVVQADCTTGGAIVFAHLPFFDTFQKALPQPGVSNNNLPGVLNIPPAFQLPSKH
jgi:hypothetical protein